MTKNKSKSNEEPASEPATSPSKVPLPSSSSTSSLPELLTTLSSRLLETESSLNLLLESPMALAEQMESLPLLDRAKFYVTLTYAIDSLIFCFLRTKGANFKDHPVMRELERVKVYIRKVNAAEQFPTDRTLPSRKLLILGNLVVDKPAAQRMIMHSIPKNQIVPNLNTQSPASGSAQKRVVQEISSDEGSPEEGQVPKAKKAKTGKCKPRFASKLTRAEKDTDLKSGKPKNNSADEGGEEATRTEPSLAPVADEDEMQVDGLVVGKRKAEKSPKKSKKQKVNGASETEVDTNNEVTAINEGDEQAKKKKVRKNRKGRKGRKNQNVKA